ncbi:MAG: HD domain-containing protein [Candidatus Aminicenantes bacterium]|nr:HD domain-containing protein [Candidatus Aminicenantes bacterium]
MKQDKSKRNQARDGLKVYAREEESIRFTHQKIKIFDLDWLRLNWNIDASPSSLLISYERYLPEAYSKIEAYLKASRILERLEDVVQGDNLGDDPQFKRLFRARKFFNSELIYFLASTDSSEENLGHSRFVAAYTVYLAKAAGINNRRYLVDIERGALLHDLGKIGIPETILQKDGPLTSKEMEIIKYHPLIGFAMIEEFSFLQGAAEIVLFHHERYDGSGYPFGLEGAEIPLSARIFALADTLDAITSNRPYRQGRSFVEALQEIEKCRGSQFDPELVDIMLNLPVEKWQKIKEKVLASLKLPIIH